MTTPPTFASRRDLLLTLASLSSLTALPTYARPHRRHRAATKKVVAAPAFDAILQDLHKRTFSYFWDTTNALNGLAPDNWPNPDFCSIAATGFALTAYCIGAKSGYVSRADAALRTVTTLRTFWNLPQGPQSEAVSGYKGFFYHFLHMDTGLRYKDVELSSVDTCWFICGALTAAAYFDGDDPVEAEIRKTAIDLYERVDWTFMARDPGLISMGWTQERAGQEGHDANGMILRSWDRYNEGSLAIYLLATASPTHPAGNWQAWADTIDGTWGPIYGETHLGFSPLFGHQYSHTWFDFRGIADDYMRRHESDYFTNSRKATLSQRNYAILNPGHFKDYGADVWGLTACRGPGDVTAMVDGRQVEFHEYGARGSGIDGESFDDGTIAPTAGASSVAFAPDICIPLIHNLRRRYGDDIYGQYGFFDAFNPTFPKDQPSHTGHHTSRAGWVAYEYLGIDQGPILAMLENYRSDFVWDMVCRSAVTGPIVRRGFTAAGFQPIGAAGKWLTAGDVSPPQETQRMGRLLQP